MAVAPYATPANDPPWLLVFAGFALLGIVGRASCEGCGAKQPPEHEPSSRGAGIITLTRDCEIWGFVEGVPVVIADGSPGAQVEVVGEDDDSVQVRLSDGTPAWVPHSCLR